MISYMIVYCAINNLNIINTFYSVIALILNIYVMFYSFNKSWMKFF